VILITLVSSAFRPTSRLLSPARCSVLRRTRLNGDRVHWLQVPTTHTRHRGPRTLLLWACRIAAPSEHDDARIRKVSGAIHRREFVLRDPCRNELAMAVHAAMAVGGVTPTRGGSSRVRAARAFPACGVGAASR